MERWLGEIDRGEFRTTGLSWLSGSGGGVATSSSIRSMTLAAACIHGIEIKAALFFSRAARADQDVAMLKTPPFPAPPNSHVDAAAAEA